MLAEFYIKEVLVMESKQITVYSGAQGVVNSTIVPLLNEKLLIVDTLASEADAEELRLKAEALGEVTCVINTHEHGDHLAGNKLFACPIISSAPAREAMVRMAESGVPVRLPDVDFSDRMSMYLGERIELRLFGGHCPGATVVHFPERKLLFTGDLVFNGRMPYMGQADFDTWIAALKELATWDVVQVVPGHGPVGGKEILDSQRQWLEQFMAEVRALRLIGGSAEEIFERLLPKYEVPDRWHDMLRRAILLVKD